MAAQAGMLPLSVGRLLAVVGAVVSVLLSIVFVVSSGPSLHVRNLSSEAQRQQSKTLQVESFDGARVVQRGLFTDDECDNIVQLAEKHSIKVEEKVKVMDGDGKSQVLDSTVRSARKHWLCSHTSGAKGVCHAKPRLAWVLARIKRALAAAVATEAWAAEVGSLVGGGGSTNENLRRLDAVVLYYESGDHHDWHLDATPRASSHPHTRLLTVTVQLDEPDAYVGGALRLGDAMASRGRGDATIYPSCTPHAVLPVVNGMRHSLLVNLWVALPTAAPAMRPFWTALCLPLFPPILDRLREASDEHLGSVHLQHGHFLEQHDLMEAASRQGASSVPSDAAREQYRLARVANPSLATAWHREGVLLAMGGKVEEAIERFEASTGLRPTDERMRADLQQAREMVGESRRQVG